MYQVGDYLVYGFEGVCRVEEIGTPKLSGVSRDKLYYTLIPCSGGGRVYTPVDSGVYMRPPIPREELESLLSELLTLPLCEDQPTDPRMISSYYQGILHSHDCRKVLRLYKTIYCKQKALTGSKKSLSATDLRCWKQAEDLLCGEFSFVLDKERPQLVKHLKQAIDEGV